MKRNNTINGLSAASLLIVQLRCQGLLAQNTGVLRDNKATFAPDLGDTIRTANGDYILTVNGLQLIENKANPDIVPGGPDLELTRINALSANIEIQIQQADSLKEDIRAKLKTGQADYVRSGLEVDLETYNQLFVKLGTAYNKYDQQVIDYNIKNGQGMDKGKQQTSNDLMREKAHLYQRLKNLFTGSFRYWVKKYENPDFTTTFSGFLSNLPGYRTEHRLQRVDGDSGEVKGDPDGSNNIEDPIHGKALQEYDDQSDLLTRVLGLVESAYVELGKIETQYNRTKNKAKLSLDLIKFRTDHMDFIQSDMALGLAINNQNRLEVKGIFRGLRFYNGGEEGEGAMDILLERLIGIGGVKLDEGNDDNNGIYDRLEREYLALLTTSNTP